LGRILNWIAQKGTGNSLKETKVKSGEQVFCQKNNVLGLWWRDKTCVWIHISRHTAQMEKTSIRQGKEKFQR
jgi:hypothetical protein